MEKTLLSFLLQIVTGGLDNELNRCCKDRMIMTSLELLPFLSSSIGEQATTLR